MKDCPYCSSKNTRFQRWRERKTLGRKEQWGCKDCGRDFLPRDDDVSGRMPKVLIYDIETMYGVAAVFGLYKQRINPDQLLEPPYMLSWASRSLFGRDVKSDIVTSEEAINGDSRRITESLIKEIDSADIVIAHNGDEFDVKWVNAEALRYGLDIPSPVQTIDTLKVARQKFRLPSYKLDYIAKELGVGRKIKTDLDLWHDCRKGDKKALDNMMKYNIQDVFILEDVYIKLRPWMKSHPNMALFVDGDVCRCGSRDIDWETGRYYYTQVSRYSVGKCKDCSAWVRRRMREKDVVESMSLAR